MKQEKQMAELYLSFVIHMQMGISLFLCHPEEDSKPTNEFNLFRKILDTSSAALGKIVSLKSIEDSAILFLETIFFLYFDGACAEPDEVLRMTKEKLALYLIQHLRESKGPRFSINEITAFARMTV